jgi:hypothetical protein
MGARQVSLTSQIIGAIWIAAWSIYKFVHEMPTVREIIVSGMFIAIVFSPVYFCMVMDKIVSLVGKKKDNTSENAN